MRKKVGGGKTINKIRAVISVAYGETIIRLSTQYPVASDVEGRVVTNFTTEIFTIFKDTSSKDTYLVGTAQDVYLKTTEDDTYIYELVIE